ncbi:hypothetical protein IM543_07740 [Massilia sp. UMI-21]|nr:hypothetical protein IM543_07740 [Massilia sp. UMI-21]
MSAACLWTVKTMAGAFLGAFDSHAAAVEHIESLQAEPGLNPDWCGDLRILQALVRKTDAEDWRTKQKTLPNPPEVGPQPPLRYEGGTLAFSRKYQEVYFSTPDDQQWVGEVEFILRNIDQFAEPDRSRILYLAGDHYGIVPWVMIDPNYEPTNEERERWEVQANG